jgi:protein SCO1/2
VAAALGFGQQPGSNPAKQIGIDQKLGIKVPYDLRFTDETGKTLKLGDLIGERPVVLVPIFYGCKSSCTLIRDGMIKVANSQKKLSAGEDFDVVVLSIHPKETPAMAAEAKKYWMQNYRTEGTDSAWHFLTGELGPIRSLTQAIGFRFFYDPATGQIAHPSTIVILNKEGVISHYMMGAQYPALDFKQAIADAEANKVGEKSPTILLGCLQLDQATGKYRIVVDRVLKVLGIGTVLLLATCILLLSLRNRREPLTAAEAQDGSGPSSEFQGGRT